MHARAADSGSVPGPSSPLSIVSLDQSSAHRLFPDRFRPLTPIMSSLRALGHPPYIINFFIIRPRRAFSQVLGLGRQ